MKMQKVNYKMTIEKIMADAATPTGYQRDGQIAKRFLDKAVADGVLFRCRAQRIHYFSTLAGKNEFLRVMKLVVMKRIREAKKVSDKARATAAKKLCGPVTKKANPVKAAKPVKAWNLPVPVQTLPPPPASPAKKRKPEIIYPAGYRHTVYAPLPYTLLNPLLDVIEVPLRRVARCNVLDSI